MTDMQGATTPVLVRGLIVPLRMRGGVRGVPGDDSMPDLFQELLRARCEREKHEEGSELEETEHRH